MVCHPSMPSAQGPSPDVEQPVALQDWAQLGALGEKPSSQPASRNAVLPVGNYLRSQMRMTQTARAVTTAGKISSGGRSEPQVHPFLLTVLVSESPWQFMKASQQWLVAGAAALPCVAVSFYNLQADFIIVGKTLAGAGWERIDNCLALKCWVIDGTPWEWICPKQNN